MPKNKRKLLEIIGLTFNRLTIIDDLGIKNKTRYCTAKCICGIVKDFSYGNIKRGTTKSCGCLVIEANKKTNRKTHGLGKHPLYQVWSDIKRRCYKPLCPSYRYYGGVGVQMCKEWRYSFINFYNWAISNGWKKGLFIDKDKLSPHKSGLLYSPQLCCFLTPKESSNYTSRSLIIEYMGEKRRLREWVDILGLDLVRTLSRHRKGMSIENIFSYKKFSNELIELNGQSKTLPEWCDFLGLKYVTVHSRLRKNGHNYAEALSVPFNKRGKYKKQVA